MKLPKLTLGLLTLGIAIAFNTPASAEVIFGLSGTNIVQFDSATPGTIASTKGITGLQVSEVVTAIDIRPQDGLLYAYTNQNRIYNFDLAGANALAQNAIILSTITANNAALTPLTATLPTGQVSIDFNPFANALRIEDTADGNLRRSFASGTLFGDGQLRISNAPLDQTQIIVGAAYTNNFNSNGTVATQLFVIDAATNSLYLQAPPNDGTLTIQGTTGAIGFDVLTSDVGFDISGVTGTAYLSGEGVGGGNQEFYTVNLSTGASALVGTIGVAVQDIAAPIGAAVPEPTAFAFVALGAAGLIARRQRR